MKKIFTLLFCALALGFAANADNSALIDQCINAAVNNTGAELLMMSPDLDVNHDGVINITDVTLLINQNLQGAPQVNRSPRRHSTVDQLIENAMESNTSDPNISDVTRQINEDQNK